MELQNVNVIVFPPSFKFKEATSADVGVSTFTIFLEKLLPNLPEIWVSNQLSCIIHENYIKKFIKSIQLNKMIFVS